VVDINAGEDFAVDTASIVFESVSGINTATDGSVGIEGLLHFIDAANSTIARDLPVSVLSDGRAEEIVVFAFRRRGGDTSFTLLLGQAEFQSGVLGLVVLARFFRNTLVITELVDTHGVTTVAITTSLAVDDSLGRKRGLRIAVVSQDVDSVSQSGSGSLGPAGSAVLGNVLVLGPGDVVDAVDVSPIPRGGEVFSLDVAPGLLFSLQHGFSVELRVELKAAGFLGLGGLFFREERFRLGLFLGLLGVVLVTLGPGVSGNTPVAISFNGEIVNASDDSEETVFTPVSTPGVSDNPVLGTVGKSTPTDDGDIVVDFSLVGSINENTTGVVEKRSSSNTADDGSSLHDFAHHSLFAFNGAVFIDTVDVVGIRNEAVLSGRAVSALDVISTVDTVVPTSGLIVGAGFVSDVVLMNVFISSGSITSVATFIGKFAGEEDLRCDVDIGPSGVSHDLDTIRHGRSGSESPAGTAILGNMLVSGEGEVVGAIDVVPGEVSGESFPREKRLGGFDQRRSFLMFNMAGERERVSGHVFGEFDESKGADDQGQAQESKERFACSHCKR